MSEMVSHDFDGGNGDHGLGDIGALLVILGQASPPSEPPEGSFDHPAAGSEDEAAAGDAPDDDQRQPEQEARGAAGRPPGLADGSRGAIKRYWSSPRSD